MLDGRHAWLHDGTLSIDEHHREGSVPGSAAAHPTVSAAAARRLRLPPWTPSVRRSAWAEADMLAVLPWRLEISGAIAVGEVPAPVPGAGEVLVRVAAAGLNRADLLQMRGQYPPPPGASSIPGLECAGVVDRLGEGVEGVRVGDRVMALLAGGGQAEWVAVPAGQLMPVPANLTLEEAAAIPEAALTAWTNLVVEGELRAGETVLVTGATSGIGTFAVQLIRELGGKVIAAARSAERLERLRELRRRASRAARRRLPEARARPRPAARASISCSTWWRGSGSRRRSTAWPSVAAWFSSDSPPGARSRST